MFQIVLRAPYVISYGARRAPHSGVPMSMHRKLTRPRLFGAVASVAVVLGGAFAAQAVADTTPAPAPPKSGPAAPETAPEAAPAPAGEPRPAPAAPVADDKTRPAPAAPVADGKTRPAPAGKSDAAPRVVEPGSAPAPAPQK
ncbi:hypothetical protein ACIP93_09370 [Streptomyces sp. NPDC088745]|uniref:hypothetical protein n=1 Tax=Streptomyces sp. NPDC088745 TaxID=3365884 RepID=UPI003810CA91